MLKINNMINFNANLRKISNDTALNPDMICEVKSLGKKGDSYEFKVVDIYGNTIEEIEKFHGNRVLDKESLEKSLYNIAKKYHKFPGSMLLIKREGAKLNYHISLIDKNFVSMLKSAGNSKYNVYTNKSEPVGFIDAQSIEDATNKCSLDVSA